MALFWKKEWVPTDLASISPCTLLCNLLSSEWLEFTFVAAHLSDKPERRKQGWLKLKWPMDILPMSCHVILLADDNSIITPGVDSETISEYDNLPAATRATAEVSSELPALSMGDAWQEVYGPVMDHDDPWKPKGWTWRFHTEAEEQPHSRKIDKIHLSRHLFFSDPMIY